jgi:phenylacetate-coenzyme A ligase PaaK-like adenylate-forming protein
VNIDSIFSVTADDFEEKALAVFAYQFAHVPFYQTYCKLMHKQPGNVRTINDIPFLPIEFFKTQQIIAEGKQAQAIFESSTTTGTIPSKHFVADLSMYETSFLKGFEAAYGNPKDFLFLALLPSYLERGNSSLVYMANQLIALSEHQESGFILHDFEQLKNTLQATKVPREKIILLGVTYALLDFAEQFPMDLNGITIMETGGMKGRRAEMTRMEIHRELSTAFCVDAIHSEYGMTELLSQAYSKGNGIFKAAPWMKVLTRDMYDPGSYVTHQSGGINIIDLANLYSCAFIATSDVGKVFSDGTFEVIGRMETADIRGCNLMYDSFGEHSSTKP